MKIKILKFILPLFTIFILPFSALALGQVTEPISIKNAIKGQEYQEELYVINNDKEDAEISLIAEGEISGWTKFFEENNADPIDKIMIPGGSQIDVSARFTIPKGIANRTYAGSVSVSKKLQSNGDANSAVTQKIDREVTVQVNDSEITSFSASVIPNNYDFEPGDPLDIRIIYENNGNIDIRPQVHLKISKDDNIIHNVIYPYPDKTEAIKPATQAEIIPIEIPTSVMEKGKYLAVLEFLDGDKVFAEKSFSFSVGENKNAISAFTGISLKSGWLYSLFALISFLFLAFILEKRANIITKTLKKLS